MSVRRHWFWLTTVSLSFAIHIATALLIVLLPRLMPKVARPQEQGTVELLIIEQKGANPQTRQLRANQPASPRNAESPEAEAPKAEAQSDKVVTQASTQLPEPSLPEQGEEMRPTPPNKQTQHDTAGMDASPVRQQARAQDMPRITAEAPVFNLEGTESESNAIVMGGQVLPAMRDDKFRNRPPIFPAEAAMLGQYGTVVLVIHVSEEGVAARTDILESSGVESLDQAAVTAVRKWHFRPAMKAGHGIPFDMPFRFVFEPN